MTDVEIGLVEWRCQMDASRPLARPPMTVDPSARAYWRGIDLVPKLSILLTQLVSSFDHDKGQFKKTKLDLERLPYSLGGMSYAFFEIIRCQAELKSLAPERGMFVPPPAKTESLSYMLDMFLDHARRTANAIIPYLRQRYSLHESAVPKSMSDWKETHLDKLPDGDARNLVREYWERHGKKAKAYRDLAQHYTLLVYDDCMLFLSAEGTPALCAALPNNPEEAISTRAMPSYDPPIHAVPYMRELLYESARFVHRLSVRLLDPSKPLNVASLGPNIRGWMGPSRQGVRVASVGMIDAELRKLTAELAKEEGHAAG